MFAVPQDMKIISVTKLNRFAKQVLESEIGLVWVSGEISNFTNASSGHWYFTLKDDRAQVKAAMFKGANRHVGFLPKHGDKVLVKANISIYEARGDYQLIAQSMEPEGVGKLKLAFEALKTSLQQRGIFEQDIKQSLPKNIRKIGVVSSATGAAIHDILHVLKRRNPSTEVIIYPSMVQGDTAAKTIVEQIEKANERNEVDVLVVGRGGGSLEDLWPFNEESVALAIYNSRLPIVSAVGHEVDVTIADFAADVRAATPSAAAELLSVDRNELTEALKLKKQGLMRAFNANINNAKSSIKQLDLRLNNQHPKRKLQQNSQSLDYLHGRLLQQHPNKQIHQKKTQAESLYKRLHNKNPKFIVDENTLALKTSTHNLERAMRARLGRATDALNQANRQILRQAPDTQIRRLKESMADKQQHLYNAHAALIKDRHSALGRMSDVLNAVSPLATLSRGYTLTTVGKDIIRSINQVNKGETIDTKTKDGVIRSTVTHIQQHNKNDT